MYATEGGRPVPDDAPGGARPPPNETGGRRGVDGRAAGRVAAWRAPAADGPADGGAASTAELPPCGAPSEEGRPALARLSPVTTGPGAPAGAPADRGEGRTPARGPPTAGEPLEATGGGPVVVALAVPGPAAVGEVAPPGTAREQAEPGGAGGAPSGGPLEAPLGDKGAGAAAPGAASQAGLEEAPGPDAPAPAGGRSAAPEPREPAARGAAASGRSRGASIGSSVRSMRSGRADRSTASRAGGSVGDEQHSGGAHALQTGQGMMTSPEARRAWTMQTR